MDNKRLTIVLFIVALSIFLLFYGICNTDATELRIQQSSPNLPYQFIGASTDSKSSLAEKNVGSTWYETDTGLTYIWSGSSWVYKPSDVTVTQADTVKTRITGVDYMAGRSGVDASTEVLTTITYPHHEVHGGNHYYAEFDTTLANGDTLFMVMTTADTTRWAHVLGRVAGTFITKVRLYENPTLVAGSETMTPINSNRNKTNGSIMTFNKDAVVTAWGTRVYGDYFGSSLSGGRSTSGGFTSNNEEIVFKQNEQYVLVVTSETNANIVKVAVTWYEHTDKNN